MSEEGYGMNYRERSPKSEGRRPKEGRIPKPERDTDPRLNDSNAPVWKWTAQVSSETLELREDGPTGGRQPQALDERTARFGERIIEFAKKVPRNPVTSRLIAQLVGSGTSIGANYCEADDAVSGKEFKQRIGTCRKESKETMFFLRVVLKAEPELAQEARVLWREAKELNLIFGAIWRK